MASGSGRTSNEQVPRIEQPTESGRWRAADGVQLGAPPQRSSFWRRWKQAHGTLRIGRGLRSTPLSLQPPPPPYGHTDPPHVIPGLPAPVSMTCAGAGSAGPYDGRPAAQSASSLDLGALVMSLISAAALAPPGSAGIGIPSATVAVANEATSAALSAVMPAGGAASAADGSVVHAFVRAYNDRLTASSAPVGPTRGQRVLTPGATRTVSERGTMTLQQRLLLITQVADKVPKLLLAQTTPS